MDTKDENSAEDATSALSSVKAAGNFAPKTFFRGEKAFVKGDEAAALTQIFIVRDSQETTKVIGYLKGTRRDGTQGFLAAGFLSPPLTDQMRQILWIVGGGEETFETLSEDETLFCIKEKWLDSVEGELIILCRYMQNFKILM